MLIGSALFSILSTDTDVSALVADRIFPNIAPQTVKTFPLIVYSGANATSAATMDGPGRLFSQVVKVAVLSPDSDVVNDLAIKVMVALRGKSGTYNGVRLSNVFYQDETESDEMIPDMGQDALIHIKELEFKCWAYLP